MIKSINILSLAQSCQSLNEESLNRFLQHYGIEIRRAELDDLKSLVDILHSLKCDIKIFDKFYVGYKIPQIGKEFDLLRFGKDFIINIELKQTCTEEKILKQLSRNFYYLSYIGKPVYNLCYVSDTKKIYILGSDQKLYTYEAGHLQQLLGSQKTDDLDSIDNLFNPSDYLVSPFNSTEKFLNNQYFLTHQQEEIKAKIIEQVSSQISTNFISVVGGAGTGKTLLVYDVVKELIKNTKKPLIIHCGYLNAGHERLRSIGWEIIPIKDSSKHNLSIYDIIIIDEAQRIYPYQLDKIVEAMAIAKGSCIFSYDRLQTLATWEEAWNIDGKINSINSLSTYKLSEKIRTNKEIAAFIKMLFNNKRSLYLENKGNIAINYFQNPDDAKCYLNSLDNEEWEVIRFTPSRYSNEHHETYSNVSKKTSHGVIGQEFEGVAITIDRYFNYNENGDLAYQDKAYYYPVKMLFQNITRARRKVNLIIIDNEELLNRCISILQ